MQAFGRFFGLDGRRGRLSRLLARMGRLPFSGTNRQMRSALVLLALLSPQAAHATTIVCSGEIDRLYLRVESGYVVVDYGYGMHWICTIGATTNGITSESCAALYSTLLTAQSIGKTVDFYYRPEVGSCQALGNSVVTGDRFYGVHTVK